MNLLMHDMKTISVMYVGPKARKRDTVTGFRPQLSFNRFEPTEVPATVAIALLDFPDCFKRATEENIKLASGMAEQAEKEAELQAEAIKLALQKEKDDADTTVEVNGEVIDLSKYNFGQIGAFCKANDVSVTRNEGEEKLSLIKRIRDAYRSKGE